MEERRLRAERRTGWRTVEASLIACVLLGWAGASGHPLAPGDIVDGAIRPGEVSRLEISAQSGTVMHLRLEHRHLDIGLRILGPGEETLGAVENVLRRTDPLTLTAIAERTGTQRVEVWLRSPHSRESRYRLSLGEMGPATDADRLRLEAQQLRASADALVAAEDAARFAEALDGYERATALWARTGDEAQRAQTLTRKGELLEEMGRLPESRSTLEQALQIGERPATGRVRRTARESSGWSPPSWVTPAARSRPSSRPLPCGGARPRCQGRRPSSSTFWPWPWETWGTSPARWIGTPRRWLSPGRTTTRSWWRWC